MNVSPTYAELKHPEQFSVATQEAAAAAACSAPLDPANLNNLCRHDGQSPMQHVLVPAEMTGTSTPIAVIPGNGMPTQSHHAGSAWACLIEGILSGTLIEGADRLIIPDTGGWGFSAAAVARLMGFDSEVIARADSNPSFDAALDSVGATLTRVPCNEVLKHAYARGDDRLVLDLNRNPAAWRYHAEVTAAAIEDLALRLYQDHVGRGRVDAFVAELGGGGVLGAGTRLRMTNSDCHLVGVQTPSSSRPLANDAACFLTHQATINEAQCRRYLEGMRDAAEQLVEEAFIPMEPLDDVADVIGLSGLRNVFAASILARQLALDHTSLIICASAGRDHEPTPVSDPAPPFDYDEVMQVIASLHDGDPACVSKSVDSRNTLPDESPQRDKAFWTAVIEETPSIDAAINSRRAL